MIMDEQEKYRAKIESQMVRFNETIEEITVKAKMKNVTQPDIDIDNLVETQAKVQAKLKDLEKSDKSSWQKFKEELNGLVADMDTDLRKAMVYFG